MGVYAGLDVSILDFLIKTALSGQEIRCVLAVIRHHPIPLHKLKNLLGCSKARCSCIANRLVFMKILTVHENINGVKKTFSFNMDVFQWKTAYTVNKKYNRSEKTKRSNVLEVKNFKNLS